MSKKKILSYIIVFSLAFSVFNINVFAENQINIKINGQYVEWTDLTGRPFIDKSGRTQVPLRQTMEAYGANVSWDTVNRSAIVEKSGIKVIVPIDKKFIYKNGIRIENDTMAIVKDNRTYLPIRAVFEAFGLRVDWDGKTRTVIASELSEENTKDKITGKECGDSSVQRQVKGKADVTISALDKKAEYIVLVNNGIFDVDLIDWTIVSVRGNQRFTFPTYILKAGSKVIVGDSSRNNVDFHWLDGKGVWNNSKSDPAKLYDNNGNLVDEF